MKGEQDLENFNVRVLYDKLEDQNLHLASQLARQEEDLCKFYKKICKQNEELKRLLQNMDPAKLEELERRAEARAKKDKENLQGSGTDTNIVNANIQLGGTGNKFTGIVNYPIESNYVINNHDTKDRGKREYVTCRFFISMFFDLQIITIAW